VHLIDHTELCFIFIILSANTESLLFWGLWWLGLGDQIYCTVCAVSKSLCLWKVPIKHGN